MKNEAEKKVFGRKWIYTFPLFLFFVVFLVIAIAQFIEWNSSAGFAFLIVSGLFFLRMLSFNSKKLIIENEKVRLESGLWFKTIQEVRYDKINNINTHVGGVLEFFTGNDKPVRFSWIDRCEDAKKAIEDKMWKPQQHSSEHNDLDKIEKLGKLYKDWILTKEEFEKKKKELLNS